MSKYTKDIDIIHDSPTTGLGGSNNRVNVIKSNTLDVISTADDNLNYTEPSSPTHTAYPYNSVTQSLSGHVTEVDDTPGAERLMEMHKSGTYYEIHQDGTKVVKVFGDDFHISLEDNVLTVGGNLNITVQGNANILTKGDVKQKIGGNYDLTVHGNMTTRVKGEKLDYTKGNHNIQSFANLVLRNEGEFVHYSKGVYNVSCEASFNTVSKSGTSIESAGVVYVDGSQVHFNKPGPSVPFKAILDNDPTGGLSIEDSVCEPTFNRIKSSAGNIEDMNDLVNDKKTKYPKDRTKIDGA